MNTYGWLFLCGILFIAVCLTIAKQPDPGVAWKIPYTSYPELQDIYDKK
jgi:hypothetical protein